MTEEMKTFIEWMKEYNSENGNNLSFVGCDMQLINDDLYEIKRMVEKDTLLVNKINKLNQTKSMDYYKDTTARRINRNIWD